MEDGITIHREVSMIYLPFFTIQSCDFPAKFWSQRWASHPALHFSSSTGWGGSNISCNCYIAENGPSGGFL